jgi:hypothetical protein
MDVAPQGFRVFTVTYSAIAQKLDHAQSLFDIRDLLFEPTLPLRQVAVHIAVLPTETSQKVVEKGVGERVSERVR